MIKSRKEFNGSCSKNMEPGNREEKSGKMGEEEPWTSCLAKETQGF